MHDSTFDHSLRPYIDSLSPLKTKRLTFKPKPNFRGLNTLRLRHEEDNKSKHISAQIITGLLKRKHNDNNKFDLFVPNKTMTDFKPKNTLSHFKPDNGR
jgi:hypothetical protein